MKKSTVVATSIAALAMSATAVFGATLQPGHSTGQTVAAESAEPTDSPEPSESLEPSARPEPSDSAEPSDSPKASGSADTGAKGTHGALVSVAAQDVTLVGGTNNNHGGAVSAIARGSHGKPTNAGKSGSHSH